MELNLMVMAEREDGSFFPEPEQIPGDNYYMAVNTVIEALGTVPNWLFLDRAPDIERDERGSSLWMKTT
jgi:NADPH-dependent glutamate synthase beta subunit-like oxidoreductase